MRDDFNSTEAKEKWEDLIEEGRQYIKDLKDQYESNRTTDSS